MATQRSSRQFTAETRSGRAVEPHRCIFPLVATDSEDPEQSVLLGTAFFISNIGHFATAKHVFYKRGTQIPEDNMRAIHFVRKSGDGEQVLVRKVTAISWSETSDVAIGSLDFAQDENGLIKNLIPVLTATAPPLQSQVFTYAYPETSEAFTAKEKGQFVAAFYEGVLTEASNAARDSCMITWPYYAASFDPGGRTSGGPVFDERGRVFGVFSVGSLGEYGYIARITELLSLRVPNAPGFTSQPYVAQLAQSGHIKFANKIECDGDRYICYEEPPPLSG